MKRTRRILVVDDPPDILELTSTVLIGAGYEVVALDRGAEAVERVAREAFDLVLLDINMPGMDGWETLRLMRADEQLGPLPIVMFSIKGELRDKVQSMQEGAVDYISKPFVIDTLLSRIERILDGPGAGAAEAGP